ncbi:hypothetical protein [Isoptericola nanjingensis]|uniref:hypothetical protein n=1 Tax=Isoptericola TaxID=254250 RepID=UPI0035E7F899
MTDHIATASLRDGAVQPISGPAAVTPTVTFRAMRLGVRPVVTVTEKAVTYEQRYANWLTWLLVVCTAGCAAFAWPWVLFGKRIQTLPAKAISNVEVASGATSVLRLTTSGGVMEFRTDSATADRARSVLFGAL